MAASLPSCTSLAQRGDQSPFAVCLNGQWTCYCAAACRSLTSVVGEAAIEQPCPLSKCTPTFMAQDIFGVYWQRSKNISPQLGRSAHCPLPAPAVAPRASPAELGPKKKQIMGLPFRTQRLSLRLGCAAFHPNPNTQMPKDPNTERIRQVESSQR